MREGEPAKAARRTFTAGGAANWRVWAIHLLLWGALFGGIVLVDHLR